MLLFVAAAVSQKDAEFALDQLDEKWGKLYHLAVRPWINNWNDLSALLKLLFLAARDIQKKWTSVVPNWSLIISQLHIFFEERLMNYV